MVERAGVRIFSDAGTLQVDQDYVSFALSAKGSFIMNDDPALHPQPMKIGSVTVPGTNPFIAFRCKGFAVNLERAGNSGENWTFNFRARANGPGTTATAVLEYWVFDNANRGIGAGSLNCGLRVFKADGSLAYDAGTKPLRVATVMTPPMPPETLPHGTANLERIDAIGLDTGRSYAAVQGIGALVFTTYDTGEYSSDFARPDTQLEAGGEPDINYGTEPPPGSQWRKQMLESHYSTAYFYENNTGVECGLSQFEQFDVGWQGISAQPFIYCYGGLMHWIIDVTHY